MNCPGCGQEVSAEATTCTACGRSISAGIAARAESKALSPQGRAKRLNRIILVGLLMSGLAMLVLFAVPIHPSMTSPFGPRRVDLGLLVGGQAETVEGEVEIIFQNAAHSGSYVLKEDKLKRLTDSIELRAPTDIKAVREKLEAKTQTVLAGPFLRQEFHGYGVRTRWSLTPPKGYAQPEFSARVVLPEVAKARDELKASTPEGETSVELHALVYPDRMTLYLRLLPSMLILLVGVTMGPAVGTAGFLAEQRGSSTVGMIAWMLIVGPATLISMASLGFCAPIAIASLISRDPSLLVFVLMMTNALSFAIAWMLCGELRWSRLWVYLVLPTLIVPILILAQDFAAGAELPKEFYAIPLGCLPGQLAAVFTAIARRRR